MRYIITTGWWCSDQKDQRQILFGDNSIREVDFFYDWYDSVKKYTSPEKIIVVDSRSPIIPELSSYKDVEFISLIENAGHSTKHIGKYCGYTRAVMMGMHYAYINEVDYWVYIEQDALIRGKGIIEAAIKNCTTGISFGSGEGTPQAIQQSFMVIRKDKIPKFLLNLASISARDGDISPEVKFAYAASKISGLVPEVFLVDKSKNKIVAFIRRCIIYYLKHTRSFNRLPFGYGRKRPIEFNDQFIYFQHGSKDEISKMLERKL